MPSKADIYAAADIPIEDVPAQAQVNPSETPAVQSLPAAGYGRREALRIRQENLDREIETRAVSEFMHAIDPSKFHSIDNEIAALYTDGSDVPNQRPDRCYCWVEWNERLPSDHGQHVQAKQSEGWKFVTKDMNDAQCIARAVITPEGYIRWGSTVLMWIERDRYVHIQALLNAHQKMIEGQQFSAPTLVAMGAKYGIDVRTELPPDVVSRAKAKYDAQVRQQRAWKNIDQQLRTGLPGHFPSS